jgi:hypothetical protein
MINERKDKRAACFLVKQLLVDQLLSESEEIVLDQAKEDGIDPSGARDLILDAFRKAKQTADSRRLNGPGQVALAGVGKRQTLLSIDAAKAQAILKRVAARPYASLIPLLNAAQLDQIGGDEEAVEIVTALRDMGVLTDDDLA